MLFLWCHHFWWHGYTSLLIIFLKKASKSTRKFINNIVKLSSKNVKTFYKSGEMALLHWMTAVKWPLFSMDVSLRFSIACYWNSWFWHWPFNSYGEIQILLLIQQQSTGKSFRSNLTLPIFYSILRL